MLSLRSTLGLSAPLRKVLLALVVLGAVALAINFAFADGKDTPRAPDENVKSSNIADPNAATSRNSTLASQPLDQVALSSVHEVARQFAETFAAYSWDDHPNDAPQRVSQWVTPKLRQELATNSGASHLLAERERVHEVATAKLEHIQTVGSSDGTAELIVILVVTTRSDEGIKTDRTSLNLRLVLEDDRWLVSEIS